MPVPVSRTESSAWPRRGAQGELDGSLQGEFEGVGEEVEDDLLPHVEVDVDRLGERLAVDAIGEAGAFHGGAEDAGQLRGAGARSTGR